MQKRKDELLSTHRDRKEEMLGRNPAGTSFPSPKRCAVSRLLFCVLLGLGLLLNSAALNAQTLNRYERILIDVSGSIGAGGARNDLFREYAHGVRQPLLTEPESSRVVVSTITTESLGQCARF